MIGDCFTGTKPGLRSRLACTCFPCTKIGRTTRLFTSSRSPSPHAASGVSGCGCTCGCVYLDGYRQVRARVTRTHGVCISTTTTTLTTTTTTTTLPPYLDYAPSTAETRILACSMVAVGNLREHMSSFRDFTPIFSPTTTRLCSCLCTRVHNTPQHNTTQHNTAQHNTTQTQPGLLTTFVSPLLCLPLSFGFYLLMSQP